MDILLFEVFIYIHTNTFMAFFLCVHLKKTNKCMSFYKEFVSTILFLLVLFAFLKRTAEEGYCLTIFYLLIRGYPMIKAG